MKIFRRERVEIKWGNPTVAIKNKSLQSTRGETGRIRTMGSVCFGKYEKLVKKHQKNVFAKRIQKMRIFHLRNGSL